MKKRFNILTVTMAALLLTYIVCGFVHVIFTTTSMVSNLSSMDQKERAEYLKLMDETLEDPGDMAVLHLTPADMWGNRDTLTNVLTGEKIPATVVTASVPIPKGTPSTWHNGARMACMAAGILLYIAAIWFFVKFFVSINRLEIFTWKNVSLLRKTGAAVLAITAVTWLDGIIANCMAAQLVSISDRIIDWTYSFNVAMFVLGFFTLIVAEVFAIGLKMREEQELTI